MSKEPISTILLDWYGTHARELPWRLPPASRSLPDAKPEPDPNRPYRVWLSEIMLQQTTVAAVKPYFAKFLKIWPTVEELAQASDEDVMAAWAGLGYYSRARNLIKCARLVAERGGFPKTETELRELPGLGAYTAASVASIAFGERAVVIDANVERVAARLFAIETPLPAARKPIREAMEAITPNAHSGDFAQAMMDLGATICTARDPKCLACPLMEQCKAGAHGDPARLPIKPAKKPKPIRQGKAFWIEHQGTVLLVTRQGKGMLGGMRGLPDDGWSAQGDGTGGAPIDGGDWQSYGMVRHTFTHAQLELLVERVVLTKKPQISGEWWPIEQLEDAGLPTLFAKAARLVIAQV